MENDIHEPAVACGQCGQYIDLRLSGGVKVCDACVMRLADEQVDRDVDAHYGD